MSQKKLILLGGPPASGKDSATAALNRLDNRYVMFLKHRSGLGGQTGAYINVPDEIFQGMATAGGFVQHHSRYGRNYGVSRAEMEDWWFEDKIPIIHVGRLANLVVFESLSDVDVLKVFLMASRETVAQRLALRHHDDEAEIVSRLKAYDEEAAELAEVFQGTGTSKYDLVVTTDRQKPDEIARIIAGVAEAFWG